MGRQLKFRIWDRQSKRFVDNAAGTHCASRWLIDAFTGRPVDFVVGFEDPEFGSLSEGQDYYLEGTKVIKEPQYVVQQFTGLKDAKGKEIYEGDILQDRNGFLYSVFWLDVDASFELAEKQETPDDYPTPKFSSRWVLGLSVVGNKFENLESSKAQ